MCPVFYLSMRIYCLEGNQMISDNQKAGPRPNFFLLLAAASLLKTLLLYAYSIDTVKPAMIFSTLLGLAVIFSVTNMAVKRRRRRLFVVYCVVSGMLFADILYFMYFGFMPSMRELLLLSQIGKVKQSVYYAMNPVCFLMIIDILPLYFFLKKQADYVDEEPGNRSQNLAIILLLITSAFVFMIFSSTSNALFVFNRYGIYAYHAYDFYESLGGKRNVNKVPIEEVKYSGYVNTLKENGKYFGIASGRNLIVIQLESFQNFLVNASYNGQILTPNLNSLLKEDYIYFDRYYQQVGCGNTSDCEFITLNSMHSLGKRSVYKEYADNTFYSLPIVLKNKGYKTTIFHGNDANFWNREAIYPAIGVDDFVSFEDFDPDEIISFGLSDKSFLGQSIKYLKDLQEPFFAMLITLTSHNPYYLPENLKELEIKDEHKNTLFADYIQGVHYADEALGQFIQSLKESGLYDKSIMALYGDHSGLYPFNKENQETMSDLLGHEYNYDEAMNIPLIFKIPGSGIEETSEIAGGQVDFVPTMLNLLGVVETKGIFFGQDLNNAKEGFVANQYHVPEGSFIQGDTFFLLSKDGIFENSTAWSLSTGQPVNINKCREGYERSLRQIEASNYTIIDNKLERILGGTN